MTSGEMMRTYRVQAGLTQSALGERIGVTGAAISSWEIDRSEPNIEQMRALAKLYKCKLDDLIGSNHKEPEELDGISAMEKDVEFTEHIKILFSFNKADRKSVYDMIDFLKSKNY